VAAGCKGEVCHMHNRVMKAVLVAEALEWKVDQALKDALKLVADLQAASARTAEQIARYNTTLMEMLFTLKSVSRSRAGAGQAAVTSPQAEAAKVVQTDLPAPSKRRRS
jgi:hypothetical protein